MTWRIKNDPGPSRRVCFHPLLASAALEVSFGRVGLGSVWKCDSCGAEWVVVSNGLDGPRKLERKARREQG